jgi:GNAT superfamily N-acetyltransferase
MSLDQAAAAEVVGYACYVRDENHPRLAEPAIVVEDRCQRRGLGRALLNQLSQHAHSRGLLGFVALVHRDNAAMLRLIEPSAPSI